MAQLEPALPPWRCPRCYSTEGTWFDRCVDEDGNMADRCLGCGKAVSTDD